MANFQGEGRYNEALRHRRRRRVCVVYRTGAGRGAVQWLVLRGVGALLVAGLTLGLAMALTGTRLVRTMLYGLTPNDP